MYKQAIRKYASDFKDEVEEPKKRRARHGYLGTIGGGLLGTDLAMRSGYNAILGGALGALGGNIVDQYSQEQYEKGRIAHPMLYGLPLLTVSALSPSLYWRKK